MMAMALALRLATRVALPGAVAFSAALWVAGCSSSTPTASGSPAGPTSTQSRSGATPTTGGEAVDVSVLSSEKACNVVPVRVPAGDVVFATSNTGDSVTGFALYEGAPGPTPLAESRNIEPGGTGEFRLTLKAGEYTAVCRPGESGAGLRVAFTVAKD